MLPTSLNMGLPRRTLAGSFNRQQQLMRCKSLFLNQCCFFYYYPYFLLLCTFHIAVAMPCHCGDQSMFTSLSASANIFLLLLLLLVM